MMSSIKSVPALKRDIDSMSFQEEEGAFWEEDPECSGFKISDKNCHLRVDEMELVRYTPRECRDQTLPKCKELVAYARYDIKSQS